MRIGNSKAGTMTGIEKQAAANALRRVEYAKYLDALITSRVPISLLGRASPATKRTVPAAVSAIAPVIQGGRSARNVSERS